MSGSDERVQEALAAYLEHLELGGEPPDTSHLTEAELEQLEELVSLLDQTEGIALGRGLEPGAAAALATTDAGRRLVELLRDVLPSGARIAADPAAATVGIDGVVEGWIVGTFGGRIRVLLLDRDGALETSEAWLRDLERVFRLHADTVAIALVEPDHSCLLVQPEDCAPTIEVPRGSLVGRRYRRPILPADEAIAAFLRELIPHWEPMRDLGAPTAGAIDVEPIADEQARAAIDEQASSGRRARNAQKKQALAGFDEQRAERLTALLMDVHDGRASPDDVEQQLREMASR